METLCGRTGGFLYLAHSARRRFLLRCNQHLSPQRVLAARSAQKSRSSRCRILRLEYLECLGDHLRQSEYGQPCKVRRSLRRFSHQQT
ncbi:Uncharacterised protein [Vibrio cholerae]|nr:Uncharacterised protein [Vibrio cholerae]